MTTTWVYKRTEPGLWTVGFYSPNDEWHPESDHNDPEEAAGRVHYLNGGSVDSVRNDLDDATDPEDVPDDYEVRPLGPDDAATDKATCGTCGRSWDDAISTSMTPVPSGRCPFENYH